MAQAGGCLTKPSNSRPERKPRTISTKVFTLSGQSNRSGGGRVSKDGIQFEPAVADKVRIWDATGEWGKRGIPEKWTSLNELQAIKTGARMHVIGPEFGFAKAMQELLL